MTILFVPRVVRFSGAPLAGSGTITQFTYTVPAGKRAVLEHILLQINGNAAAVNTLAVDVTVNIAATAVEVMRLMDRSGAAANFSKEMRSFIDLRGGDTVNARTINTAAVAVAMLIVVVIREYQ